MSTPMKLLLPIPVLAVFLLAGCGEPAGSVSGKVTSKGETVTNGSIALQMPSKGIAQNAKLDSSGKFTMSAPLPIGTYQVFYVPPTVEPQDPTKKTPPPEVKTIVPRKFHDLQTSGVSVEVKGGKNDVPIDFKD